MTLWTLSSDIHTMTPCLGELEWVEFKSDNGKQREGSLTTGWGREHVPRHSSLFHRVVASAPPKIRLSASETVEQFLHQESFSWRNNSAVG
jgi:hypothetical protein